MATLTDAQFIAELPQAARDQYMMAPVWIDPGDYQMAGTGRDDVLANLKSQYPQILNRPEASAPTAAPLQSTAPTGIAATLIKQEQTLAAASPAEQEALAQMTGQQRNASLGEMDYRQRVAAQEVEAQAFFASPETQAKFNAFKADPTNRQAYDDLAAYLHAAPIHTTEQNIAGTGTASDATLSGYQNPTPLYDAPTGFFETLAPADQQMMGEAIRKFNPELQKTDWQMKAALGVWGAAAAAMAPGLLGEIGGMTGMSTAPVTAPVTGSAAQAGTAYGNMLGVSVPGTSIAPAVATTGMLPSGVGDVIKNIPTGGSPTTTAPPPPTAPAPTGLLGTDITLGDVAGGVASGAGALLQSQQVEDANAAAAQRTQMEIDAVKARDAAAIEAKSISGVGTKTVSAGPTLTGSNPYLNLLQPAGA